MKFDLGIINTSDSERITLNIISRHPRCFGNIFTILDTGSPRTIISAMDAYLLKFPIDNLSDSSYPIKGFGKGEIPCKVLDNFKFYIKSSDGKIKYFQIPIHIVNVKGLNKEAQENAYKIPSLIGMDFLKNQSLKLVADFKNNSFYLEE